MTSWTDRIEGKPSRLPSARRQKGSSNSPSCYRYYACVLNGYGRMPRLNNARYSSEITTACSSEGSRAFVNTVRYTGRINAANPTSLRLKHALRLMLSLLPQAGQPERTWRQDRDSRLALNRLRQGRGVSRASGPQCPIGYGRLSHDQTGWVTLAVDTDNKLTHLTSPPSPQPSPSRGEE